MKYTSQSWLGPYNVYKDKNKKRVTIYADILIYGSKASEALAINIAKDVRDAWNLAGAVIYFDKSLYHIHFAIRGYYTMNPIVWITGNKDYKKVFMRIEDHTDKPRNGEISYMDSLSANSGLFLVQNVIGIKSTTEAHEMGHRWGRIHDIGGSGRPGIMWPRGTSVSPIFRYDAKNPNSTLNPEKRRVASSDVLKLGLSTIQYDSIGRAFLGKLTNKYHSFK